jgi:hypothetical protein
MAENKKSFILYCDIVKTVEKLPNEVAGELFKHLLDYVNDKDPKTDNFLVEIAFEPIKQQLKRDLNKWEDLKKKRSDAGKKSAEKRKKSRTNQQNSTSVNTVQQASTNSTVNVNDNVNVNVTVNDNEISISKIDEKVKKVKERFKETDYSAKERNFKTDKNNLIIRLDEFLEEVKLADEFKNKQYGPTITWFWRWLNYNKPKEVVLKDNSTPSWVQYAKDHE